MCNPGSAVTEQVIDIFRRILDRSDLDLAEDFFAAGGTSLLAVQAATIISDEFSIDFSPLDIFDAPDLATIGGLASRRSSQR